MKLNKLNVLYYALLIANTCTIIAMYKEEENKVESKIKVVAIGGALGANDAAEANKATTFFAIQKFQTMAKRVASKVKKRSGTQIELMEEKWPMPNPFCDRINQGLCLAVNQYGLSLYTPWGEKKIYAAWGRDNNFSSTFEAFKKAGISLRFIENIGEKGGERGLYFFRYNSLGVETEIFKKNLHKYKKTSALILSSFGHPSIYHIVSVKKILLPKPKYLDLLSLLPTKEQYNRYKQDTNDWNLRKSVFDKEKAQKLLKMAE